MKTKSLGLLSLVCALVSSATIVASDQDSDSMNEHSETRTYEAKAEDVATLDGILAAVYDVISGPAGAARDWDRMRSLLRPEIARLISVGQSKTGEVAVRSLTPDEYIENASGYFANAAFFESELSRKVEKFGHIAHVFSTYQSVAEPGGEPFDRGINSFQLMWDENRWWVITIYWDRETEANPIPAKYLE